MPPTAPSSSVALPCDRETLQSIAFALTQRADKIHDEIYKYLQKGNVISIQRFDSNPDQKRKRLKWRKAQIVEVGHQRTLLDLDIVWYETVLTHPKIKSNPRRLVYPVLDEAWADEMCAEPLCSPSDMAERVLGILSCLAPVEVACGEWEWTPAKIVNDVIDLKQPLMVYFSEGTRAARRHWTVREKVGFPALCAVALNKDAISVLRRHGQLVSEVADRICEAQ